MYAKNTWLKSKKKHGDMAKFNDHGTMHIKNSSHTSMFIKHC